jgi:hypothetical protein
MKRTINLLLFGAMGAAAAAETKPLEDRDKWTFADPAAWAWTGEGQESMLSLKRQSDFRPKVRSPINLAWFTGGEWGSFTLTADVRLDLFNNGNNDVCIAFGKESDTKFYYAHLGEKADKVHLQLHLVDDADRKAITVSGTEKLSWEPGKWHQVRIDRNIETGSIIVWFDGAEVLRSVDKTLGEGAVGIGSFDDLGSFRKLVISPLLK